MRIAVSAIWLDCKNARGAWHFLKYLLEGISKYGANRNEYVILVSKNNIQYFEDLQLGDNFILEVSQVNNNRKIITLVYQYLFLPTILQKYAVDLVFVPSAVYPIRKLDIPQVVTIHDMQFHNFPKNTSWLTYQKYKICWITALKYADSIIAISSSVKKEILKYYPSAKPGNIEVIYNCVPAIPEGIDIKYLSKYKLKKDKYIYTISSYSEHKNYKILFDIMEHIKSHHITNIPNVLVVSGIDIRQHPDLSEIINNRDLAGHIIFTEYLREYEKHSLIRYCHSFIFTSTYEGFGIPPIESLMHKKKVICADIPAVREVTNNTAIYVSNPKDQKEWVQKIGSKKPDADIQFDEYSSQTSSIRYLNHFDAIQIKRNSHEV